MKVIVLLLQRVNSMWSLTLWRKFERQKLQQWLPRMDDHMSKRRSIASSLYMDDMNWTKHSISQKQLFSTWDYRRCDMYLLVFLVRWQCNILNEPTTSEIPLLHGTWSATLSDVIKWNMDVRTILKINIQLTLSSRRRIPEIQGLWHKELKLLPW